MLEMVSVEPVVMVSGVLRLAHLADSAALACSVRLPRFFSTTILHPRANVYFAPKSERTGGFWLPSLAHEIAEATVFVLRWGKGREWDRAISRRFHDHRFHGIGRLV